MVEEESSVDRDVAVGNDGWLRLSSSDDSVDPPVPSGSTVDLRLAPDEADRLRVHDVPVSRPVGETYRTLVDNGIDPAPRMQEVNGVDRVSTLHYWISCARTGLHRRPTERAGGMTSRRGRAR